MNENIYTEDRSTGSAKHKKNSKVFIYLSVALALTLAIAALGMAVVLWKFDNQTRYFTPSPLTTAFIAAMAVYIIYSICALFVFSSNAIMLRSSVLISSFKALYVLPTLALCACFSAAAFQYDFLGLADEPSSIWKPIALAAMFFLGIIYSASHTAKSPSKTLTLISGMAQIVFCLYIMISLYFDLAVELNSPFKLLIQFSAAALLIDTCMELRYLTTGVSERAYIAAKTLFIMFAAVTFAVTVCAICRDAKIDRLNYLCYSIYFFSWAFCSCFTLSTIDPRQNRREKSQIKAPESVLTPDQTEEEADILPFDQADGASDSSQGGQTDTACIDRSWISSTDEPDTRADQAFDEPADAYQDSTPQDEQKKGTVIP